VSCQSISLKRATPPKALRVSHEKAVRRAASPSQEQLSAGGKLEEIYFAFGDVDAYMIVDLPDNVHRGGRLAYSEPNWLYREQDHRAYDRRRDGPGYQKDGRISSTGR
jgi:hypothetical protein